MGKLYSIITGQEIFNVEEDKTEPIIEGMLYSGDYALLIAEEKTGKTIASQQIACNLSSGTPVFKLFNVSRPCRVIYMFNEVKMYEIKQRFVNIAKAVSTNPDNIYLVPFKFRFNTEEGILSLRQLSKEFQDKKPDVLIIDALYKAVKGSLKNDDVVNEFNSLLNSFASSLGGCARIVVHHLNKPQKDTNTGKYYARSDKDSFGSAYLLADIDHCFRLEKYGSDPKTKERMLKCETQRSGNIIETTRLRLIEPEPLYYESISLHLEERAKLIKKLSQVDNMTHKDVEKYLGVGRTTAYHILSELLLEDLIVKSDTKVKLYSLKRTEPINEQHIIKTDTNE